MTPAPDHDSTIGIGKLKNTIQHYAWGSHTAIADLMGKAPSSRPQAELWMGAHPKAPSMFWHQGRWHDLSNLITRHPEPILGSWALKQFGPRLPFLFKVLAAGQPLSIQAHPDEQQARIGFEAENRQGIALSDPKRNYRDDQHKPECVCALSPFWALNGFRPVSEMLRLAVPVAGHSSLARLLRLLEEGADPDRLRTFFEGLMRIPDAQRLDIVKQVAKESNRLVDRDDAYEWVVRLNDRYPGDIGVLSPLILNLIRLQPGQAMFLAAGRLHAYLEGTAIELMANSDNVLRGGLTPKHVDTEQLLQILSYDDGPAKILHGRKITPVLTRYDTPATEFVLSVLRLRTGQHFEPAQHLSGVQLLLCTAGRFDMLDCRNRRNIDIRKGDSLLVPACAHQYRLTGSGEIFCAQIPNGN